MPKLILDDTALRLFASKVAGQPIYSGSDGKFIAPGIIDVVDHDEAWERWQPGNEQARLLLLGGEACRELVFQAERFKEKTHRRRTVKSMTVPLCSLMEQINRLMSLLNDDESSKTRTMWSRHDQESYKNIGRRFRKQRLNGLVRTVRNKLGAHLDQDAIGEPRLQLCIEDFLAALGDSLILFNLVTNHRHAFSWIRWIGSSQEGNFHMVETLFEYPLCVQWITDNEGRVTDAGFLQLAEDPRWKIQEVVAQTISTYNTLVDASKAEVPQIWTAPSADCE